MHENLHAKVLTNNGVNLMFHKMLKYLFRIYYSFLDFCWIIWAIKDQGNNIVCTLICHIDKVTKHLQLSIASIERQSLEENNKTRRIKNKVYIRERIHCIGVHKMVDHLKGDGTVSSQLIPSLLCIFLLTRILWTPYHKLPK